MHFLGTALCIGSVCEYLTGRRAGTDKDSALWLLPALLWIYYCTLTIMINVINYYNNYNKYNKLAV